MQDETKDHTINMGDSDRYTQQMQLIDQQVVHVIPPLHGLYATLTYIACVIS